MVHSIETSTNFATLNCNIAFLTNLISPMLRALFLSITVFFSALSLSAQCDSTEQTLRLRLQPDYYWYEVSWNITNLATGQIIAEGACQNQQLLDLTYCVPKNTCTKFTILDSYGDGIAPDGFYQLFLDSILLHENLTGIYGSSESYSFNCPPGYNCFTAINVQEGQYQTAPDGSQSWYSFTPSQNGSYLLSTCFPENTCPTKIWVYGTECQYINPTETVAGTLFYSDGGCPDSSILAQAELFLAGGSTYYIRLGYASTDCDSSSMQFSLAYLGPIAGCTDTSACNYNPLATISSDCIYPGDPNCPNAPDLVVRQDVLNNTIKLGTISNADACAVEEGCLRGFGDRTLLEFTTHIQNNGEQDYYIGQTPSNPNQANDQFVWDPCHGHWHYRGYAEYILFDENGNLVPVGAKNGFCVLDLECDNGGNGKYTCENMGISAQCGDYYYIGLPCQWIDITDLPEGNYTFVMRVNWDHTPDKLGRVEKSYDNNWAQSCFHLTYGANGAPDVDFITDCPPYTDCLGVLHGNAKPDCEGVCNGTALQGDWNQNLQRENDDVSIYLQNAPEDTISLTTCKDLYADGHLTVYDAALLQECILHENDPQHWGTRFACEFPTGKENPNDAVFFRPGLVDTVAKTVELKITNPFNKILGFELEMSGILIDSVESITPGFNPTLLHNDTRIVALAMDESTIPKNFQPANVLKIHYSQLTGTQICVDSVIAAVNDKYLLSRAKPGSINCVEIITVGTEELTQQNFNLLLVPNPATNDVHLFFNNPDQIATSIRVVDVQGKTVVNYEGVRDQEVTIPRNQLPAGIYAVLITNENGLATSRLIWQ